MDSIGLREEGQQTMLDSDILIVRTGILVLAALSVIRLVVHDFSSLVVDFRRAKRRAKKARR